MPNFRHRLLDKFPTADEDCPALIFGHFDFGLLVCADRGVQALNINTKSRNLKSEPRTPNPAIFGTD